MAIRVAIQKGSEVYITNDKGQTRTMSGTLHGYTSSTVAIKKGSYVYVYDETGKQISCHSV